MAKNLGPWERAVRAFLGVFALFAAWQFFHHPVARLAAAAFGLFALWESAAGACPLHARLGMRAPKERLAPEALYLLGLAGVQAVIAYEWWSAGWGKVSSPGFVANISKTLESFASKNPFPWYKAFLEGFAAPNATLFAYAVEWTQVVIGVTLFITAAALLYRPKVWGERRWLRCAAVCLAAGMAMNANFYLAAGWTSASTKGSNLVMFWVQAVLFYVWVSSLLAAKRPATTTQAPS